MNFSSDCGSNLQIQSLLVCPRDTGSPLNLSRLDTDSSVSNLRLPRRGVKTSRNPAGLTAPKRTLDDRSCPTKTVLQESRPASRVLISKRYVDCPIGGLTISGTNESKYRFESSGDFLVGITVPYESPRSSMSDHWTGFPPSAASPFVAITSGNGDRLPYHRSFHRRTP